MKHASCVIPSSVAITSLCNFCISSRKPLCHIRPERFQFVKMLLLLDRHKHESLFPQFVMKSTSQLPNKRVQSCSCHAGAPNFSNDATREVRQIHLVSIAELLQRFHV